VTERLFPDAVPESVALPPTHVPVTVVPVTVRSQSKFVYCVVVEQVNEAGHAVHSHHPSQVPSMGETHAACPLESSPQTRPEAAQSVVAGGNTHPPEEHATP
jgi:hypothetical protein